MNNNEEKIIYVDSWKPSREEEMFLIPDNKLVIIPFERILDRQLPIPKSISTFIINKTIYSNNLDKICKYSNYFINFYDTDKELPLSYLRIKSIIDNKEYVTKKKAFIRMVYSLFFTDSIIEKICKMVDDNYITNLKKEGDKKRSKKVVKRRERKRDQYGRFY